MAKVSAKMIVTVMHFYFKHIAFGMNNSNIFHTTLYHKQYDTTFNHKHSVIKST